MQRTRTTFSSIILAVITIVSVCCLAFGIASAPQVAFAEELTNAQVPSASEGSVQDPVAVNTQASSTGQQSAVPTKEPAQTADNAAVSQQGAVTQDAQQAAQNQPAAVANADAVVDGQNQSTSDGATAQTVTEAKGTDGAADASKPATANDLTADDGVLLETEDDAGGESAPTYAGIGVTYDTHVQYIGWQTAVKNGSVSGTSGKALRLEGIHISLTGAEGLDGSIKYTTHVQNVGWQDAVTDGEMAGTSGKSLRLEGIKVWLTGAISQHYDVIYRTHVQNDGWQAWVKNGAMAGTSGRSLRLEAIQIKLSPKTEEAAGKGLDTIGVRYQAHVQNDGWQSWTGDGKIGGTSGRSLRVEGINIKVDPGSSSGGVEYQAHVQNIGWQDWKKDGAMAGTSGKSLRVEAFRIKLTGELAKTHDIYYRTHVQNVGWLDWASNGAEAGSQGCSYRMEAIEIIVQEKGKAAPGETTTPFYADRWTLLEGQYLKDKNVNQLLEVKYTGGSRADIVLRKKVNGSWTTAMMCQGYVGELGIGKAREGDARTPEGDFGITSAFGINKNPGANLDYVRVNSSMYWCGDRSYYNQLIDINDCPHWCSGEHLIDYAPHYNYGLFIDYNTNPVVYGAGSAIFVHCNGGDTYTAGCIAMPEANMIRVIRTVTTGARVLVYPK